MAMQLICRLMGMRAHSVCMPYVKLNVRRVCGLVSLFVAMLVCAAFLGVFAASAAIGHNAFWDSLPRHRPAAHAVLFLQTLPFGFAIARRLANDFYCSMRGIQSHFWTELLSDLRKIHCTMPLHVVVFDDYLQYEHELRCLGHSLHHRL